MTNDVPGLADLFAGHLADNPTARERLAPHLPDDLKAKQARLEAARSPALTPEERARRSVEARIAAHKAWKHVAEQYGPYDVEAMRDFERRKSALRRSRYEDARPPAYSDATYASLKPQQDPNRKGSLWLGRGHKNALLMGPSGHGKTHLAYTIGNDASTAGLWVEAWSVIELFKALEPLPAHARFDEARSRRQELILGWVKVCDLLIIDDLGAETASGYVADRNLESLFDILNARDARPDLRTIITANGDKTDHLPDERQRRDARAQASQALATRYGARIATRIQADMVGIWIEGECLRKAAAWNPF